MQKRIENGGRRSLFAVAACLATWLAASTPAWADIAPGPSLPFENGCGVLGGAVASAMLAAGGCWAVWSHRRWRG